MSSDPLLQPYQLKHLTLRNRVMTTSHEPAYPDDGMPKDRYRLYHLERARAGVALTMTAGSAAVSKDSPPVFNNILAYRDEVVGWMKRLADEQLAQQRPHRLGRIAAALVRPRQREADARLFCIVGIQPESAIADRGRDAL